VGPPLLERRPATGSGPFAGHRTSVGALKEAGRLSGAKWAGDRCSQNLVRKACCTEFLISSEENSFEKSKQTLDPKRKKKIIRKLTSKLSFSDFNGQLDCNFK
jgi:hypothetical protein